MRAVELTQLGANEKALRICEKIKPLNRENATYFNLLGIICRRLDRFDEATMYSSRALQIDKNLISAKMNIANVELQKGDVSRSIKMLEEIVRDAPSYQEAKANLALAYKNIGKVKKALTIYEELNFSGPWSLKAQFNYGITPVSYTHLTLPTNREV